MTNFWLTDQLFEPSYTSLSPPEVLIQHQQNSIVH